MRIKRLTTMPYHDAGMLSPELPSVIDNFVSGNADDPIVPVPPGNDGNTVCPPCTCSAAAAVCCAVGGSAGAALFSRNNGADDGAAASAVVVATGEPVGVAAVVAADEPVDDETVADSVVSAAAM